ncbi:MAG TPA: replicative DNA helicase [Lacipirellulaceae bacterium]|nr:replicative DNA helicase [Lacipirellulaceae bacterium]
MATVDRKPRAEAPPKISELLDRQPPRSIEAERALIGSLLLLPEACDEVALLVRADDFYDAAHRTIFSHMLALHDSGKQIDPILLSQLLRDAGQYESVGGAAFLLELSQEVTTAAHAEYYARIVRDKAVLRSLIHTSTDIIQESYETGVDARQMLAKAEERVFRILDTGQESQVQSVHDVLMEALTRIDSRQDKNKCLGIETGFADYDKLTGGLQNSELVILAARPSMGKTAFALNIVEHVALDEHGPQRPVLFVSLEMSALELCDRILCSRAQVDSYRVRNGMMKADDSRKLVAAASAMSKAPLFIDDSPSRNMTEIAATARRLKRREGLAAVVIDYLQLIEPDNTRDPRQEQVARIARRLKGLARELSIPVVCLAQLNRQAESGGGAHKPQLSNLRESGAIEQDADVVMFIHREEMYAQDDDQRQAVAGQAELLIRKQRNGPIGDIKLTWRGNVTRFENYQQPEYDEFADFGPDSL